MKQAILLLAIIMLSISVFSQELVLGKTYNIKSMVMDNQLSNFSPGESTIMINRENVELKLKGSILRVYSITEKIDKSSVVLITKMNNSYFNFNYDKNNFKSVILKVKSGDILFDLY